MHESRRMWVAYTVVAILAASLLVGTCVYQGLQDLNWNPKPNAEALRREQALLALQPDLRSDVLTLISRGSSPGKPAGHGDFQLGADVRAGARYSFVGELSDACEHASAKLVSRGWMQTGNGTCADTTHSEGATGRSSRTYVIVNFAFDCGRFRVTGEIYAIEDPTLEVPKDLSFTLRTRYPNADVTSTSSPASLNPVCAS